MAREHFSNRPRAVGVFAEQLARHQARQPPCERKGKHKHRSRGAALAHVRSMQRRYGEGAARDGGEPEPYLCSCGWWHTGRRRQPG